jgi:hypothetical protein
MPPQQSKLVLQPHWPITQAVPFMPGQLVQSVHVEPLFPQKPGLVPGSQIPLMSQHPPLHCSPPEQSVPQVCRAELQAWNAAQSAWVRQPQVPPPLEPPPLHFKFVDPAVQSSQAMPLFPHCVSADPNWQVTPSQHPPWQGEPTLQLVVHTLAMQARPVGQSVATMHWTHVPPDEQIAVGVPVHVMHARPPVPHAPALAPATQVPLLQQPPLQSDDALQVVEHAPLLQALPEEQSDSVLQPHVPPVRHAEPFLPAQSLHAPPADPHAPDVLPAWQTAPSQQAPLQMRPPEQLVLHVWLAGLQA